MAKKARFKWKRLLSLIYIGISVVLIYTLVINFSRVIERSEEKSRLVSQMEKLSEERNTLSDEVKLLSDDEYVARYARDNYFFSSKGEEVVRLPEAKKK